MKNAFKIALGIVTGMGGFIDAGTVATSAQAGARFEYRLLWVVALGTLALIFISEMLGRFAAISKHTLADGIRERFGIRYHAVPILAEIPLDIAVLAAERGGMAMALKLLTGIAFPWWALPMGAIVWAVLWLGKFEIIQNGAALLGLITLCFVTAAWRLHPAVGHLAAGFVPSLPPTKPAEYWFLAVSSLGSVLSPYVLNFYAAGAVEEKWTARDLTANKISAGVGMGFGGLVSAGVLIVCAAVLFPRGISAQTYEEMQYALTVPYPAMGAGLFAVSLWIACFGTGLQVALNLSYTLAQAAGWNWSEDLKPADDTRFAAVYTLMVIVSTVLVAVHVDPMQVTLLSMACSVVVLPFVVLPMLMLMNDEDYLGPHTNGWFSNAVVTLVTVMGFVLALVAIPLQILGGS